MDKVPLFSIIIPTYNSADKLKRALDSVNKQSFRDFEVIVCDDGSTDHTKQVVDSFRDKFNLRYLWEENWGGPARPRNNGLKVAQGHYIVFLDSDDWWYPNKLEVLRKHLYNGADIIYHDLDIFTPAGKKIFKKIKGRHLKNPVFVDLMKNGNALINSSVTVKKSIIDLVGGLTEGFLTCVEDFDLWLKISRVTENFFYIPKSLGAYWIGGCKVSTPSQKIIERMEFVYYKYLDFLKEDEKRESEMVMHYFLGRIRQQMGNFEEALKLFKISIKSKNLKFKSRSACWIILLSLSRMLPKEKRIEYFTK